MKGEQYEQHRRNSSRKRNRDNGTRNRGSSDNWTVACMADNVALELSDAINFWSYQVDFLADLWFVDSFQFAF